MRNRWWPIALISVGVVLLVACIIGSLQPKATVVQPPPLEPETTQHVDSTPPSPSKRVVNIAASQPVRLRFPSIKSEGKVVTVPMDGKPCLWNGADIDPDRSKMEYACTATRTGKPYVLPGMRAKDVTVIAGHTMKQLRGDKRQIAFNPLRQWTSGKVMLRIDDAVEVYTKASQKVAASCRLVYQVGNYWEIGKGKLASATEVWGTKPMPNVLLLIGCKQRDGGASVENVVWGAKFVATAGCG